MKPITTVIFDMYGTLAQNEPSHWEHTFKEIVQEQRLSCTYQRLAEEWRIGDQAFQASRRRDGAPFQSYFDGWRQSFVTAFAALGVKGDASAASNQAIHDLVRRPLFPETRQAASAVQQRCRIAVLSNSDDRFLNPMVERLDLSFEAVVSSEQARCYKPRPDLFREVLRRLGVAAEESVYVGDRQLEDVQGASQVGMYTVWVNRSDEAPDPELPRPDYQVKNLLEIPELIARQA